MKVLVGLYLDFEGSVEIFQTPLNRTSAPSIGAHIVGLFQGQTVSEATIGENIRFWREDVSDAEILDALQKAGVKDVIDALPMKSLTKIDTTIGPLSAGQKQRVLLARCFSGRSDIIFLDEGTNNLDARTELDIANTLRAMSQTIICVSHTPQAFEGFDRFLWVENGRVDEFQFEQIQEKLSGG